jgi:hypothetical protein
LGGDLQATSWEGDVRSYYASLKQFCDESGLRHITSKDTHKFIPGKITIDHGIISQSTTAAHYTDIDIHITTHIPEYIDHNALTIDIPRIGHIQTTDAKHTRKNTNTRSHPPFILPFPRNLIGLYKLGISATTANTRYTSQTLKNLLTCNSTTTDQIDFAAAQVMIIIHEYHDIFAANMWPKQTSRQ